MADDYIAKLREVHPFPWQQVIHPNGLVQILDSTAKEVPLFALTEFVVFMSNAMNKRKESA